MAGRMYGTKEDVENANENYEEYQKRQFVSTDSIKMIEAKTSSDGCD
jgi:hypothetical protein